MCYDIKSSLRSQLKRARHYGDEDKIREIEEKLIPLTDHPIYHRQGHSHPKMFIYTDVEPEFPTVSTWGLIPSWTKSKVDAAKFSKMTLNARGETIFEKPSFKYSAKNRRCLVYIDGFYEHHHYKSKTYPFYISRKDNEPMILAGLWNEWVDKETGEMINTFSIVTTKGNDLLTKIHNNPKLKEPRMPVILPDEIADQWLIRYQDELDQKAIEELIKPYPDGEFDYYTVNRLRGKDYMGNVDEINDEFEYKELVF